MDSLNSRHHVLLKHRFISGTHLESVQYFRSTQYSSASNISCVQSIRIRDICIQDIQSKTFASQSPKHSRPRHSSKKQWCPRYLRPSQDIPIHSHPDHLDCKATRSCKSTPVFADVISEHQWHRFSLLWLQHKYICQFCSNGGQLYAYLLNLKA